MSLKNAYFNPPNGLHAKQQQAFQAGKNFVTTNLTVIQNELVNQAAQGATKFVVSIVTPFNNTALRFNNGNNVIAKSYLDGIRHELALQEIYSFDCDPVVNLSSTIEVKIDFRFNFQTS